MKDRKSWQSGKFKLDNGTSTPGELKIDGPKSRLVLYHSEFFNALSLGDASIRGILRDLTKVTLLDCVSLKSGEHGEAKERRHYAHLFPNYIVCGQKYLSPNEKSITYAEFLIDDAATLFYDFDAFGSVINARPHIADLVKLNRSTRVIPVGSNPIIQYFTGKHQIISVQTSLGKVAVTHRMSHGMGGPEGVAIKNKIWIGVTFDQPHTFHEVFDEITSLLRFFEIVIGRRQNLLRLRLCGKARTSENLYEVLCGHPWHRKKKGNEEPHPGDILLDPIRASKEFGRVLKNWLLTDKERLTARVRFASSFVQGNRFNADRTIAAANAFDLLPASAVPAETLITGELLAAKLQCRSIFKCLSSSPERDSVLNALGRIGKSTLKRKVRHRAHFITAALGETLPDLEVVADEAVNCRNFYVHGGVARIDYRKNYVVSAFLTESLEFIFSASELVEAGWDIRLWKDTHSGITNPIGSYIINYLPLLERLRTAIADVPPNSKSD